MSKILVKSSGISDTAGKDGIWKNFRAEEAVTAAMDLLWAAGRDSRRLLRTGRLDLRRVVMIYKLLVRSIFNAERSQDDLV